MNRIESQGHLNNPGILLQKSTHLQCITQVFDSLYKIRSKAACNFFNIQCMYISNVCVHVNAHIKSKGLTQ